MEETLAHKITKIIGTLLMGVLVLSFAFWGVNDVFRSVAGGNTAARAGSEDISMQDYQQSLHSQVQQLQERFKVQLSEEAIEQYGLPRHAINMLINEALLKQETAKLGLSQSDEAVKQAVRGDERLYNAQGKFSRAIFEQFLKHNGVSEAHYVEDIRQQLATDALFGAFYARVPVTKEEVALLTNYREEQRKASLLVIPKEAVKNVGEPNAAELKDFYEKEKEHFAEPETRKVTYLTLSIEDVAHDVDLSDATLKAEYEQHKDSLGAPEKRTLKQVVVQDPAKAKAIAASLDKKKDMQAAAKQAGEEKAFSTLAAVTKQTLDEPGIMPEEAITAIFTLPEGGHTEPFKSDLGWHVVQVEKIEKGKAPSFEDSRQKLRQALLSEKGGDALYKLSTQVEDKLAGGATLEEVATAFKLTPHTAEGLKPNGKIQKDVPDYGDFASHAFKLGQGELSELVGGPDGTKYYVVRVDGITPPHTRTLDEVKGQVATTWKELTLAKKLKALAEEAAAKVADGKVTLEKEADALGGGAKVVSAGPMKRDYSEPASIPPLAVQELFTLQPGKSGKSFPRSDSAYVIPRLDKVFAPEDNKRELREASVQAEISHGFEQDVREQMLIHLRNSYKVKDYVGK